MTRSRHQPALPGETARVTARRALVVAPHYDDELLGCGGLLLQLLRDGAAVHVLYLSDGSGGEEVVAERAAYTRRRRAEAAEVARSLRFTATEELALRDGALAGQRDVIAQGIRRALESQRPDLVLVPSPTEISDDHRTAFAALGDAVASLRPGDRLHTDLAGTTFLLYEVNHPAHPDLLVDVSAEMEPLARAIRVYGSQLEMHNYLDAAIGLRQYRTLSLPPNVRAAEAYRRLSLAELVTRSAAELAGALGALPAPPAIADGPLVSVVVRTFNRPDLLREALASLAASAYRKLEVVLVNDGGAPADVPSDYALPYVRVDLPENQGRAAAAGAGVAAANGDYIAFLDDDDLVAPDHFTTLVGAVAAAGVRVVYTDAAVGIYELGAGGWQCRDRRLPYSRDYDPDFLLLDNYIPLNTLLIERALCTATLPFDPSLPFFEDWDFLIRLAALSSFHHVARVTCEYRHFLGGGDQILGADPCRRDDFLPVKARVLAKHAARLTPAALARAIDTMRAEAIRRGDEADAATAELRRLQAEIDGDRILRAYRGLRRVLR